MLEDLKKYIINEDIESEENCRIFLVIDTDLSNSRINKIEAILEECKENNIEVITSAPTFEIWYLMHYRNDKLTFNSSKDVKKELVKINGKYKESMNMYDLIKTSTEKAIDRAKKINVKNNNETIKVNPHSDVYKILECIMELNKK